MSIYTECLGAAYRLLDQPSLRPITVGPEGLFTEMDVIVLAAREGTKGMVGNERAAWMDEVQNQAPAALSKLFRGKEVVRFGPVQVPGAPKPDYMRVDTKIAYASTDGPPWVETPNGTFDRIYVDDDPAKSRGRKWAANRTDLKPWEEQTIMEQDVAGAPEDEVARLRSLVASLRREKRSMAEEIARLKSFHRALAD